MKSVHSLNLQAMAEQGSGGAFEISQRMTAMLGWGATSGFKEDWTWDQAAETYAMDPEMAETLRKNNPQVGLALLSSCPTCLGREHLTGGLGIRHRPCLCPRPVDLHTNSHGRFFPGHIDAGRVSSWL